GELGHNIMDHIKGGGAHGTIPGNEDRATLGRRPNIAYMPRFRNVKSKSPNFLRGYGLQADGGPEGWGRGAASPRFGADFKRAISRPGPWSFIFYGYGECLPNNANYVEINKNKLDAWGIPTLKIHVQWRENELAIRKDMAQASSEMLGVAGARSIEPFVD